MSGHSKWATTKRKKAVIDAKRGKIFTKLIKEITIAAKSGGGDVSGNPRLRLAVENAKAANMPQDNIERAIKKATGDLEGVTYYELMYEGYGPGGIAILVEVATDNKNRTVAEVRHSFSKSGGSMGDSGSVAWMFNHKGVITMPVQGKTEEDILELVMDDGAEDLEIDDEFVEVVTPVEAFENVRKKLVDSGLEIENASLQWIAKDSIKIEGEISEKIVILIEDLEDNDDVQSVYSNADFEDLE